jgi:hypothetical protein
MLYGFKPPVEVKKAYVDSVLATNRIKLFLSCYWDPDIPGISEIDLRYLGDFKFIYIELSESHFTIKKTLNNYIVKNTLGLVSEFGDIPLC